MKEENFFYKNNILHYKISDKESLSFDFLKGRLFNRLNRIEHESLIKKAIGKNRAHLKIFDATAGSLIDTIILLKLGHEVIACVRNQLLLGPVRWCRCGLESIPRQARRPPLAMRVPHRGADEGIFRFRAVLAGDLHRAAAVTEAGQQKCQGAHHPRDFRERRSIHTEVAAYQFQGREGTRAPCSREKGVFQAQLGAAAAANGT